ncbi:unnamed protein product [Protopolystoma xenopodis]|uniref:Uncharacterized protein n=1 Tax=Protopolystoma xenopodis TaxID=117903 RepID=A0A448XDK6_9PLAT|nr:unnamed protein product [Protopolystoma xenopodis]
MNSEPILVIFFDPSLLRNPAADHVLLIQICPQSPSDWLLPGLVQPALGGSFDAYIHFGQVELQALDTITCLAAVLGHHQSGTKS